MTTAINTVINVFEKEKRDRQLVKSAFSRTLGYVELYTTFLEITSDQTNSL